MNVQTHMSGRNSGQIPNQPGTQLPGLPQQNGLSLSNQLHNLGDHGNTLNMETEFAKARRFIQDKIYEYFMKRQQVHDIHPKKLMDIVRRLDEGLFRNAGNKDEYLNLETLENRLHVLIKCLPMINHNQPCPQLVNSSSAIGTMIPTPGIPHDGTSSRMVASSVDTSMISTGGDQSMVPTILTTGSFVATADGSSVGMHGGSFSLSDGSMSEGYRHSRASFSMNSGGNSRVSSTRVQKMTSQMIPTPGFNATNNLPYTDMESSNNTGAFSTVESTVASHTLEQKQHVGGQNSRILHNLGSHRSGALRSGLQQKSNELLNGNLGRMQSSSQLLNCPGTSEGYLTATPYGSSPKPLHHYDQHQRPLMQGTLSSQYGHFV